MEFSIDIRRIFRQLYAKLWLVILGTLVITLIGIGFTWNQKPDIYTARVTIVGIANPEHSDMLDITSTIRNYAGMVQSKNIAEQVVRSLSAYHLEKTQVQNMLSSSFDKTTDSALFYIYADSTDRSMSMAVVNAAAEAFTAGLKNVTGVNMATIIDEAATSTLSFDGAADQLKKRFEFAAGGFIAICLLISFFELFSTRVKEIEDCTLGGTIEIVGVVPKSKIK